MKSNIGKHLRRLITESGLSVRKVALRSCVPQPVLHRFVKGERTITIDTADKLLNYFKCHIAENEDPTT